MKLHYIINGFTIVIIACVLSLDGFAQSSRSSYFMKTSYARTSLNPALRPDQSYIGVPFLSNIHTEINTNTLNLSNLTFPLNGELVTFMHPQVSEARALANIEDDNYITGNAALDIFSVGLFKGDSYWNFNFGLRTYADANVPKSLFELLKVGFNETETVTHDLSKISLTQSAFAEIGLTNSRTFLNNSLTIGARAKFLLGISYADLDAKSLNITAGREFWTAKSQVILKGAGPGITTRYSQSDYDPDRNNFDGFDFGSFSIPGYGLGLDIGGVYDFKDSPVNFLRSLRVSYALNDIGFISWTKKNVVQLSSQQTAVTISPNDYTIHTDGSTSITDIFDNAVDDIKQAINLHEDATESGYTTTLRANMIVGLEYEVWKNKMTTGFLYSTRFGKYFTTNEFTLSANYMPKSWLATSLSYSFAHSQFKTFGLAVHLAPSRGINFFLASDYTLIHISPQFLPTSSRALSLQLGLSVPFGGKR
ncbi:DUF5723 family protein [Dysgonomonas sp. ZJ709]|uniref:DUF5723 family protein n=1 Tax=Dysgonomonas sp. ZJ709 TaxID=2709797 RepID=UPI0013EB4058|nr:DUF5723 family protein [Dysgonomonas sp. ZJ709]